MSGASAGDVELITLPLRDAEAMHAALRGLLREQAVRGGVVPHGLLGLLQRVRLHLDCAPPRTPEGAGNLDCELVRTAVAAGMLGRSPRWVQKHWRSVGGVLLGDRLWFSVNAIREYADAEKLNTEEAA